MSNEFLVKLKLDFGLLGKQKNALLGLMGTDRISAEERVAFEGLLGLIDHVQDTAVVEGVATEKEVFPRTCILTGKAGEDPDDCTTHEHESDSEEMGCSNCEVPVCREDPYFATPCGTYCSSCMHGHAKECEICREEFNLGE